MTFLYQVPTVFNLSGVLWLFGLLQIVVWHQDNVALKLVLKDHKFSFPAASPENISSHTIKQRSLSLGR